MNLYKGLMEGATYQWTLGSISESTCHATDLALIT